MKIFSKKAMSLLIALPLFAAITSFSAAAVSQTDAEKWSQDIDAYWRTLEEKHIDLYHQLTYKDFEREINSIKSQLPSLSHEEIVIELMRLTHKVGDGHTTIPLWDQKYQKFPLELKVINNEVLVTGSSNEYANLIGNELVAINGTPIKRIYELFAEVVPFAENDYSTPIRVAQYMMTAELLRGFDIINDEKDVEFTFKNLEQNFKYHLSASQNTQITQRINFKQKLPFKPYGGVDDDLWYGAADKGKTVYVNFEKYSSMTKMDEMSAELLRFVNHYKTENIIIDLRGNEGGDFFIGLKLAQVLVLANSINWKSGVYVMIDNETYSAAMSNASQYAQLLNATLVGQPTGSKPTGYQDMWQFSLPNSGLIVTYSKRMYRFKDGDKEAIFPDVAIELTAEDYMRANDKSLQWVIKDINTRKTHTLVQK
ncbi:S41 family peptidase [Kangiella koreensis]|uniref:Peptidase S41 n=1 Tax=Kangiella koreensis (strain DSM 16069 / JCM 12317 / KCTC 12182 / SW-125) TaxID=523791 RepID=C7R7P7_KANKD|nr:S41 family peptidase [Kangiella koreensis]ACV27580.1 peptidase S41 [Kangiella koreensis DSM 16069]